MSFSAVGSGPDALWATSLVQQTHLELAALILRLESGALICGRNRSGRRQYRESGSGSFLLVFTGLQSLLAAQMCNNILTRAMLASADFVM